MIKSRSKNGRRRARSMIIVGGADNKYIESNCKSIETISTSIDPISMSIDSISKSNNIRAMKKSSSPSIHKNLNDIFGPEFRM